VIARPRLGHSALAGRGLTGRNRGRGAKPVLRIVRKGARFIRHGQEGRWGYVLAWLLGVPIPILILIYLLRGCT